MNEIGDKNFALRNVMRRVNGMPNATVKSAFRVPPGKERDRIDQKGRDYIKPFN